MTGSGVGGSVVLVVDGAGGSEVVEVVDVVDEVVVVLLPGGSASRVAQKPKVVPAPAASLAFQDSPDTVSCEPDWDH